MQGLKSFGRVIGLALCCCTAATTFGNVVVAARQYHNLMATTARNVDGESSLSVSADAALVELRYYNHTGQSGSGEGFRGTECDNSIYSNTPYDEVNAYASVAASNLDWKTADDVTFTRDAKITGIAFWAVNGAEFTWNNQLDFYAFKLDGSTGGPGEVAVEKTKITGGKRTNTGKDLFGTDVWLYTKTSLAINLPASDYFVTLRPRTNKSQSQGINVISYWLTAANQGSVAWFDDTTGWVKWSDQVQGETEDVAFCLVGTLAAEKKGACCESGGVCEILSSAECKNKGGTYQGDDTSCNPNNCPGAPGACCEDNGNCQYLSEDDCNALGGTYQGKGINCELGTCNIPDPCADAIYSNGVYDYTVGLTSERSAAIVSGSYSADDIALAQEAQITGLHFYCSTQSNYGFTGLGDYIILAADGPGGAPGSTLVESVDVPCTQIFTGDNLFGTPIYLYTIDDLSETVSPGTVYIGVRPVGDGTGRNFIVGAPVVNSLPYLFGPDFGINEWTRWDVVNPNVFSDINLCVIGTLSGEQTGQCCFANGDCQQLSETDCDVGNGSFGGNGSSCVPNTCPGAEGACCLDDGSCSFVKAADCSGSFAGEAVPCSCGLCVIQPPCDSPLYDNLAWDGVNGLTSERSGLIVGSYTADDFTLSDTITITTAGFFAMTEDAYGFAGTADIIIVNDGGGFPSTDVAETLDAAATSINTSCLLFGTPVYQYKVTGLSIALSPGTYFCGLRPVGGDVGRSFNATAPSQGANSFLKSDDFGFADWTDWNDVPPGGVVSDIAFCLSGSESGPIGACCLNGACTLGSKAECTTKGGKYQGDGTNCAPNPCPDAPGACCAESGACTFVSKKKCDTDGGTFQGVDVTCTPARCPLPEVCDGTIYNNNVPDKTNGLACDRGALVDPPAEAADDIELVAANAIGSAHWFSILINFTGTSADVLVYADDDGKPAVDPLVTLEAVPATFDNSNGDTAFGFPLGRWSADNLGIALDAGIYWIELRPVSDDALGQSFWATAGNGDIIGTEAHGRSEFFGYPDWTPTSDPLLLSVATDLAFCLNAGSADPCSGVVRGDADGDGLVTFNDIDCFVAALIGFDDWEACGTSLSGDAAYVCANDIDGDKAVTFNDIDGFIECLINEGCP